MATNPQTAIDALEAALASGDLNVEYDGFRRTFRSVDDIMKSLAYWRAMLAARTTQTFASFTRD